MTSQPPIDSQPGEVPPRRRLDRAPSERYGPPAAAESGPVARQQPMGGPDGGAGVVWPTGMMAALATGALGALAVVVLYGLVATTIGLLAIAAATGYLAGLALRGRSRATAGAVTIAAGAMILGILGGWAVSLAEGGIAGPLEYVWQTLGPLAVIVPLVGAAGAWLGSRQVEASSGRN